MAVCNAGMNAPSGIQGMGNSLMLSPSIPEFLSRSGTKGWIRPTPEIEGA